VLHAQVRSQEKTLIWIEGADDLTQEAQAFLRRILDTRSPDVMCILEVRDPSKLSAPVLSRCSLQRLPSETSYRKTMLIGKAQGLGLIPITMKEQFPTTLEQLASYKQEGKDPVPLLWHLVESTYKEKGHEAIRRWSSGASPWLQVAWLLSSDLCG